MSPLSVAGKILGKVMLEHLQTVVEDVLPGSRCGFRADRTTIDMILTLCQPQEKSAEQYMPLYILFNNFSKAFDSVSRAYFWRLLLKYGCPDEFVARLQGFHVGMQAQVLNDCEATDPFPR